MKLRVARHTSSLPAVTHFYCDLLGLEILGSFTGHNGYDGVFIGLKNENWHLEFTTSAEQPVHEFDEDDLLVFYQPTMAAYFALKQKFADGNITAITPKNPYWQANGTLYHDPDGYGIMIAPAGIY